MDLYEIETVLFLVSLYADFETKLKLKLQTLHLYQDITFDDETSQKHSSLLHFLKYFFTNGRKKLSFDYNWYYVPTFEMLKYIVCDDVKEVIFDITLYKNDFKTSTGRVIHGDLDYLSLDDDIKYVGERCKNIKTLTINHSESVDDETLKCIIGRYQVHNLNLQNWYTCPKRDVNHRHYTESTICDIIKSQHKLIGFSLSDTEITHGIIDTLLDYHGQTLEHFSVGLGCRSGCDTTTTRNVIRRCPNLKSYSILRLWDITDTKHFTGLNKHTQLITFELVEAILNSKILKYLAQNTKLRSLKFNRCRGITTDNLIELISHLPELETIDISIPGIDVLAVCRAINIYCPKRKLVFTHGINKFRYTNDEFPIGVFY